MNETNFIDVISIVLSRLTRADDSLEVFRSILNLSITSKSFKNYMNDKLLIDINRRLLKHRRALFVTRKLRYFVGQHDFANFKILSDQVVAHYSRGVSGRVIKNMLIYARKHNAPIEFMKALSSYILDLRFANILPNMIEYLNRAKKPFIAPAGSIKINKQNLRKIPQVPIDKQPWFFGNLSPNEIEELLPRGRAIAFLVVFHGSRLYCHQGKDRKRIYNLETQRRIPNYAIINNGPIKDCELYQFYCRLVEHDLECMKQLEATHRFSWETMILRYEYPSMNVKLIGHQPHPLLEYLNVVDDIREDIVDWLFELCSLNGVAFEWERNDVPDSHVSTIKKIIKCGATISTNLLTQFITKIKPTKTSELTQIVDSLVCKYDWNGRVWEASVWKFVFSTFTELYKQHRFISETKMTVLLAWKFADGESIGFRNLPKEMIQTIIGFIHEPENWLSVTLIFARTLFKRYKALFGPTSQLDWMVNRRRWNKYFNNNRLLIDLLMIDNLFSHNILWWLMLRSVSYMNFSYYGLFYDSLLKFFNEIEHITWNILPTEASLNDICVKFANADSDDYSRLKHYLIPTAMRYYKHDFWKDFNNKLDFVLTEEKYFYHSHINPQKALELKALWKQMIE